MVFHRVTKQRGTETLKYFTRGDTARRLQSQDANQTARFKATLTITPHCCSLGDTECPLREAQAKESPPSLLKGAGPNSHLLNPLGDHNQQPKTSRVCRTTQNEICVEIMPFSPHWVSWRSLWLWETSRDSPTLRNMNTS